MWTPRARPRLRIAAGLAALGALAVTLLALRLGTLAPAVYPAADPGLTAAGFYPPEQAADGTRFRWSRPRAGFLLPALATRQVYTVELAAPRPAGVPAPQGIRLEVGGTIRSLAPGSTWAVYTATAASQIGLEDALALVATTPGDSFYPPAGDRRLLTLAVRQVSVAPAPGPGGIPWPAPLLAAGALLAPALAFGSVRFRRGRRPAAVAAAAAALAAGLAAWVLPAARVPAALTLLSAALAVACFGAALLRHGPAIEARLAAGWLRVPPTGRGVVLAAIFAGLALAATWPLATRLGDALPGWPGDNFAFLYKIWWVKTALTSGANLFADPHVFYPFGFEFGRGEPTLPNTVPGALLALLWGDAAGYNLVLLGGFVLSGLGTYGLARAAGAPRPAALLAGVIFMLAPYRLAQAAGHLQIAATWPIPLTFLCAERALQGRRRAAPLAGLFYGLTVLTAWYYAVIFGLCLMGYVVLHLVRFPATRWPSERHSSQATSAINDPAGELTTAGSTPPGTPSGGPRAHPSLRSGQVLGMRTPHLPRDSASGIINRASTPTRILGAAPAGRRRTPVAARPGPTTAGRARLRDLLLFGLVAGVVALPGLLPALGAAREAPLTHSAKAADENSASLADYAIPNELQPLWGAAAMRAHRAQNIIEDSLYLGVFPVLLAGLALWPRGGGRRTGAGPWAVLAIVCLVLSLGLTLRVGPGEAVMVAGAPLALPARILYDWVPGFASLRAYARFGGAVVLAVAILAALGAARLLARPRLARARVAFAGLLLAGVLLDFWSAPDAWGLTSVAPDPIAGWLAAHPGGAVLRLPLDAAIAGPPLYAGTAYGHPLAYGYETFEPPGFAAARPVLARFPSTAAFTLLHTWGVRYVVVTASSYGAAWAATDRYFAGLPAWTPVYRAPAPVGYQAPFWVGDVRPELLPAFTPDTYVVYELR